MVNADNFLDLWDIFVNELFGDIWLFFIAGLILTFYLVAKRNMPLELGVVLSAFWGLIIFAYAFDAFLIIYTLILLFAGGFFFFSLAKALRRT